MAVAVERYIRDWRCAGVRSNGQPCRQRLATAYVAPGSIVQIKCHKCGTVNTIDKRHEAPAA
jgi:phage FluMu protein Com